MKRLGLIICILPLLVSALPVFADTDCNATTPCDDTVFGGVSIDVILNYPEPDVQPLEYVPDQVVDRWYKQVNTTVNVHNVPGGEVVRTIPAGFNYVTALQEENGWTKINNNEWVQTEFLQDQGWGVSQFTGVQFSEEALPFPMAWLLVNLYPSLQPGEDPFEGNGLLYRYTLVNLYATVAFNGYDWYQIGVNQWVHQHHVAKVLPVEKPTEVDTDIWISIDLYEQIVVAYKGETPVFATLISSGMGQWPTREGIYHIYYRKQRKHMSGGVEGDDYYFLEEVPWTMFFDEGRALHGAYWHNGFGYRRSHGCVNLSITDAKWLYEWVAAEMGSNASSDREEGPAVYVYSSGEYQ